MGRTRLRRVLTCVALGTAAIVLIVIALLVSLPLLLDSESVKAAALQQLSRATGGQWHLSHVRLRWLPAPTISATDASVNIPGTLEGRIETLTLTTALLPLLWGEIRLSHVALIAPDLTVTVASAPASAAASGAFTVSDLRAALTSFSGPKAVDLGSVDIAIERGRLVRAVPNQVSLMLTEIGGRATQRSGRLEVEVTSASNVARRLSARISLDAERFEGSVQLEATGIDLATLLAVAGAPETPRLQGLISAPRQDPGRPLAGTARHVRWKVGSPRHPRRRWQARRTRPGDRRRGGVDGRRAAGRRA